MLCLPHHHPFQDYAVKKAGRKYPWMDLKQLKDAQFFLNDPSNWKISGVALDLLREAGIQPNISYIGNIETCLSLSAAGMGATLSYDICMIAFRDYTPAPCFYSVGNRARASEFVAITRKDYRLSAVEEELLALIRQKFGDF